MKMFVRCWGMVLLLALASCEKDSAKVSGITVTPASVTLEAGKTVSLKAAVVPETAADKTVRWESENPAVADVTASGVVTAKTAGETSVTAVTTDGNYRASCLITVIGKTDVTGVRIDETFPVPVGKEVGLNYAVLPTDASVKTVLFTVEKGKESVLTLEDSNRGIVKGVAVGTAQVTVTTAEGGYSDSCAVTVYRAAEKVTITSDGYDAAAGLEAGLTLTLTATVSGEPTYDTVFWATSDPQTAAVDADGTVTAKAPGTVTVRASLHPFDNPEYPADVTAEIEIDIVAGGAAVESVAINEGETVTMFRGETKQLTCTVNPPNASEKTVVWSVTEGADVVSVNADTGEVTALGPGRATVTVTSRSDATKTDSCTVTVREAVTAVRLDRDSLQLTLTEAGKTETLTAAVEPQEATDHSVLWTADPEGIVSVENGTVTALNAGTATVRVESVSNPGVYDECEVTVISPVTQITLNHSVYPADSGTFEVGLDFVLSATVTPGDATDKRLIWSVSPADIVSLDVATGTAPATGTVTVTALKAGTATVTVTAADGFGASASCDVTVSPATAAVTKIVLNRESVNLYKGKNYRLTASVEPPNAADKTVTWSLEGGDGVATLSDDGHLSVDSNAGAAMFTVKATAGDASGVTATCAVTVRTELIPAGALFDAVADVTGKQNFTEDDLANVSELEVDPASGTKALYGLELMPNLLSLDCSGGYLTDLDTSMNPKLETLICNGNSLEKLDLRSNSALKNLVCGYQGFKKVTLYLPSSLWERWDNEWSRNDSNDNVTLVRE